MKLLKGRYMKVNKHMKSCLTSSVIRNLQFKNAVKYYCTSTRKVKIKNKPKPGNTKCGENVEYHNSHTLLIGDKMPLPFWKIVWQFLITLFIHLAFNPSILPQGIYTLSPQKNTDIYPR